MAFEYQSVIHFSVKALEGTIVLFFKIIPFFMLVVLFNYSFCHRHAELLIVFGGSLSEFHPS